MRITNEEIEIRAEIKALSKHVARRRWMWPGRVLRIDHHLNVRFTLIWLPENSRNRGSHRGIRRKGAKADVFCVPQKGSKRAIL